MRFSTLYSLCARAVVATFDLSAVNLHLLRSDHWLSNSKNVIVLELKEPAWQGAVPVAAPTPQMSSPRSSMRALNVDDLAAWACARDLGGPAKLLRDNAVTGADLLDLDLEAMVKDLRFTPFAARKVLCARQQFLAGS